MKLSSALKSNAAAFQESQTNYQQAVYDVSNMMTSVFAATLPSVNNVPANWNEIKVAYTQARADALKWTNQVYATLAETPDDVRNYNEVITDCLNDAIEQAEALIADPDDTSALSTLNADLVTISSKLRLVNTFVSGCLDSFNEFGYQTLPEAAGDLSTVSNDAYIDRDIDQQKIDDLKKQIKALQDEITALAAEIGINSAALAATLVVGACFAELGPAEWAIVGIGVALEATTIALDVAKLKQDQAQLKTLNSELDSYEQDAAALQITADQYSLMSAQTVALGGSVDAISSSWTSVENDVTAAINDITDVKTDEAAKDYNAVYADLVDALNEWNSVYTECGNLEINLSGNPATLTIGMTSEEVASATAEGTVDYVTYINNYNLKNTTAA